LPRCRKGNEFPRPESYFSDLNARTGERRCRLGCSGGAILGATWACFGNRIGRAIQSLVDILLSFPQIVLAIVVVAALDHALVFGIDLNLILAITIPISFAVFAFNLFGDAPRDWLDPKFKG
jgi:ABC-type dipeptide/oligopeptide/nickel transport system permease subunit